MTWCGNLALAALLAAGEVPDGAAARVQALLAERWDVPAGQVVLEWGRAGAGEIADDAPFRLLGDGRSGRFVVAFRLASGETAVALRAGVRDSVWVTARSVSMGSRLEPADLERAERLRWGAPAAEMAGPPIGWEVRRNLAAGAVAEAPAVAEPPAIEAGDEVRFVWERAGFRIVRVGVATGRARTGERVMARDPVRGDQLYGTVTAPGRARLEQKRSR